MKKWKWCSPLYWSWTSNVSFFLFDYGLHATNWEELDVWQIVPRQDHLRGKPSKSSKNSVTVYWSKYRHELRAGEWSIRDERGMSEVVLKTRLYNSLNLSQLLFDKVRSMHLAKITATEVIKQMKFWKETNKIHRKYHFIFNFSVKSRDIHSKGNNGSYLTEKYYIFITDIYIHKRYIIQSKEGLFLAEK